MNVVHWDSMRRCEPRLQRGRDAQPRASPETQEEEGMSGVRVLVVHGGRVHSDIGRQSATVGRSVALTLGAGRSIHLKGSPVDPIGCMRRRPTAGSGR